MTANAVAERYARALFELADEFGQTAEYAEKYQSFAATYANTKALREVVESPVYTRSEKLNVVAAVAKRLGMTDTAQNGIKQLLVRGRLSQVGNIAARLRELSDEKAGIVRATLTTAEAPSAATLAQIKSGLEAAIQKKIEIQSNLDASLIGGVIVDVAGVTIDASVRGRLEQLERGLNAATERG